MLYGVTPQGKGIQNLYADKVLSAEVMQFTGLKDKNGKEIYEGDIVKNIDRVFEVTFKDGYFSIIHNKKGLLYCEVIGNKYENSELLKE